MAVSKLQNPDAKQVRSGVPCHLTASLLAALLLACGARNAPAQVGGVPGGDPTSPPRAEGTTSLLFDAPVSRTQYQVGPGDVLTLSLFGSMDRVYSLPVTPEGTVVIPSVGVVNVLNLNLDQAQGRVRDRIYRYYQGVEANLTLSQARRFKVFVVGNVPEPGLRVASSATRVSEVVPGIGTNGVVQRNVIVQRASGDTINVDLVRFRQTGDLAANPTLREGDAVVVPTIDQTVQIYGRVHFPGTYEYRPEETLAQLLLIANGSGSFPSNAADTVRVTRFVDPERREFYNFTRAEALGEPGRRFSLQPFDALYVAAVSNFKEQKVATAQGEVVRPGIYPIKPDTTTVRDLVAMAGGFTETASLVGATLLRQVRAGGSEGVRDLQNVPFDQLTDDERRILQVRATGGENRVVIDFRKLFLEGGDVYNQTLESGDVLSVPQRRSEVVVLGAVLRPGIVPYTSGEDTRHFVALAGGFGRRADRSEIVVLKAGVGTPTDLDDVESIDPGDTVIVPYKRRVDYLQRLQTTQAIIGTVSGLVLSILALRQLF